MNIWKYLFFIVMFLFLWFMLADWGLCKIRTNNLEYVNKKIEIIENERKIITNEYLLLSDRVNRFFKEYKRLRKYFDYGN